MAQVHDAGMGETLKRRVLSLRPDSPRQWGKMTADQMLHHVNLPLAECLGEYSTERTMKAPRWLMRFLILNVPWGKGAPTRPDMKIAEGTHFDFEREKQRCLQMIDRVAAKPLDGMWPPSANMGAMTGRHWSKLQAKHLNHHLRQFGA